MNNQNILVVCIASAYMIAVGIGLADKFEQGRNKSLVTMAVEDLSLLEWSDAIGNRQKIEKQSGVWYYAGMEAVDSASFSNYLSSLVNVRGDIISDLSSTSELEWTEQLILYGAQMNSPTIIQAYPQLNTKNSIVISSTATPGVLFLSDSSGLYKRIFTDIRKYWPYGQ